MTSSEIAEMVANAVIPTTATKTNLLLLKQPQLRAVVTDRAYKSLGQLKSISLNWGQNKPSNFYTIFSRLALEILLADTVPGRYVRHASLGTELLRRRAGAEDDSLPNPGGLLVIPDLGEGEPLAKSTNTYVVCSYLLDYVARGGAILVSTDKSDEWFPEEFNEIVRETFMPLSVV